MSCLQVSNVLSVHLMALRARAVTPYTFSVEVASKSVATFICLLGSLEQDKFKLILYITRAAAVSHTDLLSCTGLERAC